MVSGSLIVIGHFGHWYISLPVYLGPALAIVLWLWLGDRRARARADHEEDEGEMDQNGQVGKEAETHRGREMAPAG
ncbi:MAG: hypothetical protein K6U89_17175 [Chloroflexi bacterium]|nr:hypothetical protein [Chloroflexota bacterium]